MSLGNRLRSLESKTAKPVSLFSVVRIIAENEGDRERQIAQLRAAGALTPEQSVICRLIVSPEARQC